VLKNGVLFKACIVCAIIFAPLNPQKISAMKKTLLSLFVAMGTLAFAQPNLTVTLNSPTNGSTINAGTAFNFEITIQNSGNASHLGFPADTVAYWPLFNGQPLGNGQGGTVGWYSPDAIAANANVVRTHSLNVSGGSSGQLTVCAYIRMGGSSYTGFVRDTTDNCSGVTYNATMSIGDFQLKEIFDNSFYSGGVFYAQLSSSRTLVNPTLEIIDISGRTLKHLNLTANGNEVNEKINVEDLPHGIYVTRISHSKGLISVAKFAK